MKKVDLSKMKDIFLFTAAFENLPKNQRLVNQLNLDLGWSIKGAGAQDFANSLVGIAGNLAALKWCITDLDRSVYRLCAGGSFEQMQRTRQYKLYADLILLPSWIYKSAPDIQKYSHGPKSTRLP